MVKFVADMRPCLKPRGLSRHPSISSSPGALLNRDFFGKRLIHGTPTVSLDVAEQSCRAMPVVVPSRIVSYRVQADPFDRNAGLAHLRHLMPDDPEPGRPHIAFDAGLGEEHRPLVTIVDVG